MYKRKWLLLLSFLAVSVLLSCGAAGDQGKPTPGPYVTVYRDDAVAFQVRHDRIRVTEEGTVVVWVRWLWAEPIPSDGNEELARLMVLELDCAEGRLRELALMRKNRAGEIFESLEHDRDDAQWIVFDPETGAEKTFERLCEFVEDLRS